MNDKLCKPETLAKLARYKRETSLSNLKEIIEYTTDTDKSIKDLAIQAAITTTKHALFESYHEMDQSVRRGLVNLLMKMNTDIVATMNTEMFSPDIFKRVRAVQILGLVGKRRSVEQHLVKMIRDSDEKIRATVIRTLGELIDKSEANMLLALLNDFDSRVRANTIEALENLGNKNLTGILIRYRNDSNNRIRANALKALWNLGHKDINTSLEEMLTSSDENMRASGIWLIGELGQESAMFERFIKDVKYSDSILVRNNLIRTLLKMNSSFSQMYLDSLFDKSEIEEVKQLYRME